MIREMDEAGIAVGIAPSRFISNEHLTEMVEHFRGRFVGMASIDSANSIRENLDIIRTYAVDGPLKGIHFEPGHSSLPLYADDPKFYPIYEYCQEQGLVVGIMLGGNNGPNLINHTNPAIITQLAADFPGINWFICHGGWPWVTEILGACFWHENIWIEPDLYMFNCPGAQEYINAANGFLQDRLISGGKFKWDADKYPGMKEFKKFGPFAYLAKLRNGLFRSMGACLAPQNAFLNNLGLETLGLRMQRHCSNAMELAEFLNGLGTRHYGFLSGT